MKKLILFTAAMFVLLVVGINHIVTSSEMSMQHHAEILVRGILMGCEFALFIWGLITVVTYEKVDNQPSRRRRATPKFKGKP